VSALAALVLAASCPVSLEPEARAEAACALLEQQANATAPDRATLEQLLDEPRFARARNRNNNTPAVLWARFWAWLQKLMETQGATRFARLSPYAVLGLAFFAALYGVLRFRRREKVRGGGEGRTRGAAPLELDAPEAHLGRARALLEAQPREAIREGLLALLSSLERRRFARPDRVKTNRELCAELPLRGAPEELTRAVAARMEWYDRTFYSLGSVERSEAGAFVDAVASLAVGEPS
jgi:hypothetical protein